MASVSSQPGNSPSLSVPESSIVSSPQQISAQRSIASADVVSPRIPAANTAQIIKLQHHLEGHQGQRLILVIQDFPDPDALSSAWAFQLIAAQYEIQCDIVYAGTLFPPGKYCFSEVNRPACQALGAANAQGY